MSFVWGIIVEKLEGKIEKIQLYGFKGFDMDSFFKAYLDIVSEHDEVKTLNVNMFTGECTQETIHHKKKIGSVNRELVCEKCLYVQDFIIRCVRGKEDCNSLRISSSVLKSAIGAEYVNILYALKKLGYIAYGGGYIYGTKASTYYLSNHEWELSEPAIHKNIQIWKQKAFKAMRKMVLDKLEQFSGKEFIKKYEHSLSLIKIEDYEGMRAFANARVKENPKSSDYYDVVFAQFEEKERHIQKVDDSGRIYHLLTNLKREMKQYLSIDFSLDCRNSHPLLFNHFIFENKGISTESSYMISYYMVTKIGPIIPYSLNTFSLLEKNYHYLGKDIRNILITNNIENQSVAKLSDDELEYIFMTSTGRFWYDFLDRHKDISKEELKPKIFAAVFYANTSDCRGTYSKEFQYLYPTVFNQIRDWKKASKMKDIEKYMRDNKLPFKQEASLSIAMMAYESIIFKDILVKLYKKRWNAVNLHDCIVIPRDGCKNHPTKEQVAEVMRKEFAKYGLYPSFS